MVDLRAVQDMISILEARGFFSSGPPPTVLFTTVGNVDAGEDDLITSVLAANKLDVDGKIIRITAFGTKANNANAKGLQVYFGSSMITVPLTANEAGEWRAVVDVIRTGVGAQKFHVVVEDAPTVAGGDQADGTLTEDETAAITIKCTGEATTTDDIQQTGLIIEILG